MTIEDIQKVKLESGDILVVTLPKGSPSYAVERYYNATRQVVRGMGLHNVGVCVVAEEVAFEIVKRSELADIKQRLDDLEERCDKAGIYA